jgi:pyrimidine-specific ribonucleoside hydrolase
MLHLHINGIYMKRPYLIITALFLTLTLHSHPWKPSHYVIIDTDGGIDDMRAISMLLASPDVRVLAITVSPGALSAENAYIKVRSLLNSYYHEGIPVGINRTVTINSPEFPAALQSKWGDEEGIDAKDAPDFTGVISEMISAEKTRITFVCLGGMSTAFQALRSIPEFGKQTRDFLWSADGSEDKAGFNYNIDKKSSVAMLKQEIPVKIVRKCTISDNGFFDEQLINSISGVRTIYAKKVTSFFRSAAAAESHRFSYEATDEMTALFLHYPDLFISKTMGNISDCMPSDLNGLRENFIRILKGETVGRNQVIREFPQDPTFYYDDLAGSVTEIIEKHGINEWVTGVLANEMHRAREYFNTGVDEFSVKSYAGSVPPVSCFNDGLQASTGATPGHGLLTVVNDPPASPSAEFTYLNRTIRLTLRKDLSEKILAELKEINFIYGLDSNTYWELVRKNSIKYWLSLDRHEIFEIEEIK